MSDIYAFLAEHSIPYERHDHPAVFTCEEAAEKRPTLPGADTKNLLVRNKKGDRMFLVVVGHDKRADLQALRRVLDVTKLSFASPERLLDALGVTPGSVTLLGLTNDTDHKVEVVIDQAVWDAECVQCHPLINTSTLVIPHAGLEKLLEVTGHEPTVIDVPGLE